MFGQEKAETPHQLDTELDEARFDERVRKLVKYEPVEKPE